MAVPLETAAKSSMAVEAYIFQHYAQSLHKPLTDVIGEVLGMTRSAGFRNIELSNAFFSPPARDLTLRILHSHDLRVPSLYVGGEMHNKEGADKTIATALELGKLCLPLGCKAIVNNPDPKRGDVPKMDSELDEQARQLNRMGHILAQNGLELRVHHHTPQLEANAREWRHILQHTDPDLVRICVDVDWAYEAGFEPLAFLKEAGNRVHEIHVRSARNKIWLEDLEDSDIDYRSVAEYLKKQRLTPLIVVELAYRPNTVTTRPLAEDLRLSRIYAEQVFGVRANE